MIYAILSWPGITYLKRFDDNFGSSDSQNKKGLNSLVNFGQSYSFILNRTKANERRTSQEAEENPSKKSIGEIFEILTGDLFFFFSLSLNLEQSFINGIRWNSHALKSSLHSGMGSNHLQVIQIQDNNYNCIQLHSTSIIYLSSKELPVYEFQLHLAAFSNLFQLK